MMSTPTDDLEAIAIEIAQEHEFYRDAIGVSGILAIVLAAFARSLVHPPSELVNAGNAMREELRQMQCPNGGYAFDDNIENAGYPCEFCLSRARIMRAWDAALAAHPKEVAPTVEETVDELMEFLEDYIEEGIEEMHDHSSDHGWQYDRGHPNWSATMDDLRARLKTLFP